ncbi:two-component system regulatory protein YycI [Virgibacillus soli]|uniref:Two-component system regulatory protein YycI n=1 Tax=Paracerasibacillus soli TaxID=480284 RepID=A0ABU5CU56_9BACI|nr:two-component system regulatory protein YycI [Virgibacillus soli]MDY0409909.1 two-component system regulatory protein YycI [Virgibacillus soli]
MQWSQIKSLFIICFLVLDIFLVIQFLEKQESSDIGLLERQDVTVEQQLADENIKIKKQPSELPDESFISVKQRKFEKEDIELLLTKDNQDAAILNDNLIVSELKKPIKLAKDTSDEQIMEVMSSFIMHYQSYQFGEWDKDNRVIYLFQVTNQRPVYFNKSGIVILYMNEDNEITSYTQTMLDEPETNKDKKSLIKPTDAVWKLYENNRLKTGEEITDMRVGYHTVVPLESGVQVFVPTWNVTVNNEQHYFVNAIEGMVFPGNQLEFLKDAIKTNLDKIIMLQGNDKLKDTLIEQLEDKLEQINRSDIS